MTLSDIAVQARFKAQTDSANYPDANLLIHINMWYQKIISMILESADESDFDDANQPNYPIVTRPMIAAQRDYAFSTAAWTYAGKEGASGTTAQTLLPLKIKRLDVTYDGVNYYPSTPIDDGEIAFGLGNELQTDQSFLTVYPRHDVKYNSLNIYPMATSDQVVLGAAIRLEQERNVIPFTGAQLTAGTLTPGFDAPFHPMLSEGAAFEYAKAKNYPQVGDWEKDLLDWENRLRTAYGRKELDRRMSIATTYDDTWNR